MNPEPRRNIGIFEENYLKNPETQTAEEEKTFVHGSKKLKSEIYMSPKDKRLLSSLIIALIITLALPFLFSAIHQIGNQFIDPYEDGSYGSYPDGKGSVENGKFWCAHNGSHGDNWMYKCTFGMLMDDIWDGVKLSFIIYTFPKLYFIPFIIFVILFWLVYGIKIKFWEIIIKKYGNRT